MKFKTFTSYDAEELDNLINSWLEEARKERMQILDVKQFACFSQDGKPFFSVNLIYQKIPDSKEVPNPCAKSCPTPESLKEEEKEIPPVEPPKE